MLRSTLRRLTKPNVVVLGTGWAGSYAAHHVDPNLCNIHVISTRNHMVFTPLLPQTTTGTLEFRSVCEPITNIQPALAKPPHRFLRSVIYDVDFDEKQVKCVGVGVVGGSENVPVNTFSVPYDYLIMAYGARPNTFNIPGVEDKAFFLREVNEARGIRKRLVQNIMTANLPTTSIAEAKRLLHTVVVGGGPTGIEFAANLAEFFREDIKNVNTSLLPYCKVTVLEAGEVLGSFDNALRRYGQLRLNQLGVEIRKTAVVGVTDEEVFTKSGEVLPTGLVVWSTGVGSGPVTKALKCDKTNRGRISIDDHLRVLRDGKPIPNVFAAGDCAANNERPLPTLAAVASRQGRYIGKETNNLLKGKQMSKPFVYRSLGSMASIGNRTAIVSLGDKFKFDLNGCAALWVWKSAYLTILGSIRSKLYVIVNWAGSQIFGRDITYIGDLAEDRMYSALAVEEVSKEMNRKKTPEMPHGVNPESSYTSAVEKEGAHKGFLPRKLAESTPLAPHGQAIEGSQVAHAAAAATSAEPAKKM
ncbi:putative NADH dehydrogenase [Leishmania major strain Friedlin]|uniref:Putative NADH dehydrogenase n=1 Tax=Leishmania major TaxID=5664 RepID=Q4Q0M3_LEIMA|nr:putative NADH dehydrogenase [Leishmania major strain Friedlin]CAG9584091.1 NADH_dehydrogenase_-_putative [Leishmania major strain Friedlin]CAJ09511.1 putative NADH dehydrogenase [Leishmania major strain Friedlin]|eukprot:XP_001687125.1 putative NADH dehydrogenase [Leishmania major strain Friedlin]